jgi:predicted nucleotidyltransferase
MTNLFDQHRDEVAALCRLTGPRKLDAFGSAFRADFDPQTSDLDFLLEFDDIPRVAYAKAYFALSEGLESLFCRPVDLVTGRKLANFYFRERITPSVRPSMQMSGPAFHRVGGIEL